MGAENAFDAVQCANMNGVFYVKDFSSFKDKKARKCHVSLDANADEKVILLYEHLEPHRLEYKEATTLEIEREKWLVYFADATQESTSLVLTKKSDPLECIVFEARNENVLIVKMMESKLREFLRVISFDVKIQDTRKNKKVTPGVLHITRDKVLLTCGFPPIRLLEFSLSSSQDGVTICNSKALSFSALPYNVVLSDQTDNIWRTLQGCMKANGFLDGREEKNDTQLPPVRCEAQTSQLPPVRCEVQTSTTPQYVYHNLPSRPCRYLYMNLPDKRKIPYWNHNYVNVFHVGSVYQNCWQNHAPTKSKEDESPTLSDPPPPPPRLRAPPLPPKPGKRRPDSPLPPTPEPRRTVEPPPLPVRRSPETFQRKEIQYVIFSSKPVAGQMFVIQVVFLQKNDDETLQRIKRLEEEANYQVLKPLPETLSVNGDVKVSLMDINDSCCMLKSDQHQDIEYEIVKEAMLQSCWLIIEFHLEHNDQTRRNFHARIVMQPKLAKTTSRSLRKETQISTTFQDVTQNGFQTFLPMCNSLKGIGVRKYLEVCSLMDISCALHNDWSGLAGEVGLTVDEVFKIQSRTCFPNFSPTNEVLNIWSQRHSKMCNLTQFKKKLENLQRFDVLALLEDTND